MFLFCISEILIGVERDRSLSETKLPRNRLPSTFNVQRDTPLVLIESKHALILAARLMLS